MIYEHQIEGNIFIVHHTKRMRQKHIYLRIKDENTLSISSNILYSKNDAKKLLLSKEKWIMEKIKYLKKNRVDKDSFFYLGSTYLKKDFKIDSLEQFYKSESKRIITPIVDNYSSIMDLYPNKISYRNNKSRWGSCSSKNNISLNIQLMKLPLELIDYVVVHELAHIRHKNHQKNFYKEVQKVLPNYKQLDKTLKEYSIR